jgi:hypothetical protein
MRQRKGLQLAHKSQLRVGEAWKLHTRFQASICSATGRFARGICRNEEIIGIIFEENFYRLTMNIFKDIAEPAVLRRPVPHFTRTDYMGGRITLSMT